MQEGQSVSAPLQYVLDTDVLSEKRKNQADMRVMSFLAAADPSALYLSVLTLGELRKGVALKMGIRSSFGEETRVTGRWTGIQLCGSHPWHRCGNSESMGRIVSAAPEAGHRNAVGGDGGGP